MAEEKQDEQEQGQEQLSELDSFAKEFADSRLPNDVVDSDLQPETQQEPEQAEEEPQQGQLDLEEQATDQQVEEAEEVQETTAEQTTEEPVSSQPKTYTVPDDEVYGELRGKKATALELEAAGLLDRLLTRDHQELHHVKLYQGLKKEFDALKEGLEQPQQDQQQPQIAPEQVAAMLEGHYGPQLKEMAEQGAFEKDFLHVYPKVAAHMEHRFQSGGRALMQLVQQVHELTEYVGMKREEDETTTARVSVESKMDSLVEELPALADQEIRGRFVQWAIDENNPLTNRMATKDERELTAQDLRGAFAAYVAITGDGLQVKSPPKQQQRQQRARMAAGGGSGSGGGGSTPQGTTTNEFEDFEREFQESRR
jgi:hypothetical protein